MKVFFVELKNDQGLLSDLALRARSFGHDVRIWYERQGVENLLGMVDHADEWEKHARAADLVVVSGCESYPAGFEKLFAEGVPILGTNMTAAKLELDRGHGQEVLADHGIKVLPYEVVDSWADARAFLLENEQPVVIKPWGGEADKALTHVCKSVEDGLFMLNRWAAKGPLRGQLMLQEKVDGIEIGIAGWFGPAGWNNAVEESFEHKKFLTGDLGQNTGEMGTILAHSAHSRLFDEILAPLTDHLHLTRFVGCCSVNCIVDPQGQPWPLEFTMRMGWPSTDLTVAATQGDPILWMSDLVRGRDSMSVTTDVVCGVVMVHGDFPHEEAPKSEAIGFPIRGISSGNREAIHYKQVKLGTRPEVVAGSVQEKPAVVTAGTYPFVVTGVGPTVKSAKRRAYAALKELDWPSNVMYRLDIGDRLRDQLLELHKHGYALGIQF